MMDDLKALADDMMRVVSECDDVGALGNHIVGFVNRLNAISRPAGGECPDDATASEVVQWFLRTCREMKPVGQWPGERVCTAIERVINAPRRFIAEADLAPYREESGRVGFRRDRVAAPTPHGGEDARDAMDVLADIADTVERTPGVGGETYSASGHAEAVRIANSYLNGDEEE